MTREEIIKMASEAEFEVAVCAFKGTDDVFEWGGSNLKITKKIERLVALAAAAEREACARTCEARIMGDLNREDQEAQRCADDIRARGEK